VSGFTSMFSQLLKLFPRTEFRALPEKLADWSFCVSAADRGAERTSRASTTARNLMNRLEVIERAAASLEWHRAVAPVWEVGEITTYGLALSRPRRGFESRWGHHHNWSRSDSPVCTSASARTVRLLMPVPAPVTRMVEFMAPPSRETGRRAATTGAHSCEPKSVASPRRSDPIRRTTPASLRRLAR